MDIETASKKYQRLLNRKEFLNEQTVKLNSIQSEKKIELENLKKARFIISEVNTQTQQLFQNKIEKLVTSIVQSVFDRPFEFKLNFEIKRNKAECQPTVIENNKIYNIKNEMGGSIADIIGFGLRIILWSMKNPRSRNFIVLDEPFKFCGAYTKKAGKMISELSKKMNLQFLIVTHSEEMAEIADKSWFVTHNGIKSSLKEISNKSQEIEILSKPIKKLNRRSK